MQEIIAEVHSFDGALVVATPDRLAGPFAHVVVDGERHEIRQTFV